MTWKKKESGLVMLRVPCTTNLFPEGPSTVREAERVPYHCPRLEECKRSLSPDRLQCTLTEAVRVAREVLSGVNSLDEQMRLWEKETAHLAPTEGWIFSPDGIFFPAVRQGAHVSKVAAFAAMLIESVESGDPPIPGIELPLPPPRPDVCVDEGPCPSCSAWHKKADPQS